MGEGCIFSNRKKENKKKLLGKKKVT